MVNLLEDRKAEDIVLLDLRPDAIIADYFVIATGLSERQLRAMADHLRQDVREQFNVSPHSSDMKIETGGVVLDYGDIVVHLFMENEREYYDLEGFWDKANVVVSIQ